MKGLNRTIKWFTAAVLLVAMSAVPVLAQKTTPATDKNTNVPAVPRAIPDLIPYHKYDPPKSKLFDIGKLTMSGDMRVRPEYRNNGCFGGAAAGGRCVAGAGGTAPGAPDDARNAQLFVQQLIRLGFNYDLSPDVTFFVQPQVSNNFGSHDNVDGTGNFLGGGGVNPNSTQARFFLRQGFMLIRNFGVENLSLKAGRQLVVWGNHRIFGHFDWNNVGFSFDGITARYVASPNVAIETAWIRWVENNLQPNVGGANPANGQVASGGGRGGVNGGTGDSDILFARVPMKFAGVVMEPAWIWESGGGGGNVATAARPGNVSRHTVGGRITTKKSLVDFTGEAYYQFGRIGANAGNARDLHINAFALHADVGVTLPVPMQPRLGFGFEYASGDGDNNACAASTNANQSAACGGNANTFSQFFPTNHIHFGYMDLMSWKNMVDYNPSIQMRPTKNSHLDIAGHILRLASGQDNWYRASQGAYFVTPAGNTAESLGQEIDVVYTLFFQGNKVGWQLGYGHFFPGAYVKQNVNNNAPGQDWGYTQLWINF